MINFKKGCQVPYPEKIFEQYEKSEQWHIANISAEKILDAVKEFIVRQNDLVFFFLEIPSNLEYETEIESGVLDGTHKDVYYMDAMKEEEITYFMDIVGEILVHDGISSFGFGSPKNKDEIMICKYNVVKIFSAENHSYDDLFEKLGVTQTTNLVTAWDTFSQDSPGVAEKYTADGKDIYSIVEDFKDWGLYFAERREDD